MNTKHCIWSAVMYIRLWEWAIMSVFERTVNFEEFWKALLQAMVFLMVWFGIGRDALDGVTCLVDFESHLDRNWPA